MHASGVAGASTPERPWQRATIFSTRANRATQSHEFATPPEQPSVLYVSSYAVGLSIVPQGGFFLPKRIVPNHCGAVFEWTPLGFGFSLWASARRGVVRNEGSKFQVWPWAFVRYQAVRIRHPWVSSLAVGFSFARAAVCRMQNIRHPWASG